VCTELRPQQEEGGWKQSAIGAERHPCPAASVAAGRCAACATGGADGLVCLASMCQTLWVPVLGADAPPRILRQPPPHNAHSGLPSQTSFHRPAIWWLAAADPLPPFNAGNDVDGVAQGPRASNKGGCLALSLSRPTLFPLLLVSVLPLSRLDRWPSYAHKQSCTAQTTGRNPRKAKDLPQWRTSLLPDGTWTSSTATPVAPSSSPCSALASVRCRVHILEETPREPPLTR
jgi:hypothetical protein